jgi:ribonuclease P protein subunit POP4
MRTRKNLIYHTFIGLPVEVVQSSMKSVVGMRGKVIDETKNMLVIETERGEKKIQKVSSVFRFTLESGETVDIEGKKIMFRPEERAKKVKVRT